MCRVQGKHWVYVFGRLLAADSASAVRRYTVYSTLAEHSFAVAQIEIQDPALAGVHVCTTTFASCQAPHLRDICGSCIRSGCNITVVYNTSSVLLHLQVAEMRQLKEEEEALLARTVRSMERLYGNLQVVRQQQGYALTNLELTVQTRPPQEVAWKQVCRGCGSARTARATLSTFPCPWRPACTPHVACLPDTRDLSMHLHMLRSCPHPAPRVAPCIRFVVNRQPHPRYAQGVLTRDRLDALLVAAELEDIAGLPAFPSQMPVPDLADLPLTRGGPPPPQLPGPGSMGGFGFGAGGWGPMGQPLPPPGPGVRDGPPLFRLRRVESMCACHTAIVADLTARLEAIQVRRMCTYKGYRYPVLGTTLKEGASRRPGPGAAVKLRFCKRRVYCSDGGFHSAVACAEPALCRPLRPRAAGAGAAGGAGGPRAAPRVHDGGGAGGAAAAG